MIIKTVELLLYKISFVFVCVSSNEIYSSVAGLEDLIKTESVLIEAFKQYLNNEIGALQNLQRFKQRWDSTKKQISGNVIDDFSRIKAFTDTTRYFKCRKTGFVKNYLELKTKCDQLTLPTTDDLYGSGAGVLRVQETYDIPIQNFTSDLSTDDEYVLSHIAMANSRFYQAIPWLQHIESLVTAGGSTGSIGLENMNFNLTTLYSSLSYAMQQQNSFEWALYYVRKLHRFDPSERVIQAGNYFIAKLREIKSTWNGKRDTLPPINYQRPNLFGLFPDYEKLCRGEFNGQGARKAARDRNLLFCFYKKDKPFLRLTPVKIEKLHHDPDVFMFYDAVSEAEIEEIKHKASPKLERATVSNLYIYISHTWQTTDNPHEIKTDHRTSKNMDLTDKDDPLVRKLSQRVEDMTDLTLETAEHLKIANYGIGGHYTPHFDFETDTGNDGVVAGNGRRMATFLFYFSQPEAGGGTAFDVLDFVAPAKKGAALFWYNLHKNGEPDIRTRHGGCPILRGTKWIGNYWIHERKQELRRPCSLNKDQ